MAPTISLVITSAFEPTSIGRAIKAAFEQTRQADEVVVVCPDEATREAAQSSSANPKLRVIQDEGKGKPAALNLVFPKIQSDIVILTDGDVYLDKDAISKLVDILQDISIGGVTGCPVATNPKDNLLGFWSHFLTYSADRMRQTRFTNKQFLDLSGYLLAIRREIFSPMPEATLADDRFISQLVAKSGHRTAYAREAKVYVKFPTTLTDWFKQKKRTSLEYLPSGTTSFSMRTPLTEAFTGLKYFFTYPKTLKEVIWLKILFIARLILWFEVAYLRLTVNRGYGKHNKLWVRVPSTKT